MSTDWERMFGQFLQIDWRWGAAIGEVWAKRQAGWFDAEWSDVVAQYHPKWERSRWTMAEAFAFGQVWAALLTGQIATVAVEVGEECTVDSDSEGNNKRLKGIAAPFHADFIPETGQSANADGRLWWSDCVLMDVCQADAQPYGVCVTQRAGPLPLEVGTTEAATTLRHLRVERGLARWPYGSKYIRVLYMLTKLWKRDVPYSRTRRPVQLRLDEFRRPMAEQKGTRV